MQELSRGRASLKLDSCGHVLGCPLQPLVHYCGLPSHHIGQGVSPLLLLLQ
jgi:hypothetical protein